MWLYGGESSATGNDSNNIWRFEPKIDGGRWTALNSKAANLSSHRPTHGAGCNVPNYATGYYLGGYLKWKETENSSSFKPEYLHSITVFDMNTESISTFDVPMYVPTVDSSLVYLNAGIKGVLVVLGGQTENNGVLSMVRRTICLDFAILMLT